MEIRKIIGPDMRWHATSTPQRDGHGDNPGGDRGGVNEPDVTWNGYGDQAGFACLRRCLQPGSTLRLDTGINLEKLTEISEMVERCGEWRAEAQGYSGKDMFTYMVNHGTRRWV